MRLLYAVLSALLVVVALCSCGGGLSPSPRETAQAFSFERNDHQSHIVGSLVTPKIVDRGLTTEITLTTASEQSLYEILLNVHYDSQRYSVRSVEFGSVLGEAPEVIELAATAQLGLIALGQVRTGLAPSTAAAGQQFAKIILENAPSRLASTAADELAGRKLRSNQEFLAADVPFHIEQTTLDVTVTWEEANDGDFDNNSAVSITDLTQLGKQFGDFLTLDDDYTIDGNDQAKLERGNADIKENLLLRNMGSKGQTSGYEPVERFEGPYDLATGTLVYEAKLADLQVIGLNIGDAVAAYDVYLLDVPVNETPDGGNQLNVIRMNGNGEDWSPIVRPTPNGEVFTQTLVNLGMGSVAPRLVSDPALPDASYTYQQFCENDCTALVDRGTGSAGFTPLPEDKRIFKFRFDKPETILGDAYVAVVPLATYDIPLTEGTLGAFTYHPTQLEIAPIDYPEGITWVDDIEGITALEKTDENGTPDVDGLGFRIKWGTAELTDNPDGLWEIRYGVFISFIDDDADLFEDALGDPHSYPMGYSIYPRSVVASLPHWNSCKDIKDDDKDVNGYYYFPPSGSIIGKTLWIAVRAYAWHPTPTGGGLRASLDFNENPLTDDFVAPVVIDTEPPNFKGMKFYWTPDEVWLASDTPFRPVYALTDRDPGTDEFGRPLYEVDYMRLTHPDDDGEFGTAAYLPVYVLMDELYDIDGSGLPREDANITVRLEIYRTTEDRNDSLIYLSTHSIEDWIANYATLYQVAMTKPLKYSLPLFGPDNLLSANPYWDNRANMKNDAFLFTFCPPLDEVYTGEVPTTPPHGFRKLDGSDGDFNMMDDINFTIEDWYTPAFESDGLGGFDRLGSLEPNHDIRFVYHDTLEVDQSVHLPYKYFVVAAAADEAGNTSYDTDSEKALTWLGEIPDFQHVTFNHEPVFAGPYYSWYDFRINEIRDYTGGKYEFDEPTHREASTGSQDYQVFYPDMAVAPNKTIGVSFYDPLSGTVKLREFNSTTNVWTIATVDNAANGDTSLTYDRFGNAYVAYFGVDGDSNGSPDAGVNPGVIVTETPGVYRAATAMDTTKVGVFYRKRTSGVWGTQETVDMGDLGSFEEHSIHLDHSSRPFCIVSSPGVGGTLSMGVPACVVRTGTNTWTKYLLPVSNGLTGKYLDTVCTVGASTTNCQILIYDVIADDLLLATGYENTWDIDPVVTSGVAGYQSLFPLSGSTWGISYMSSTDNKLVYGVWDGSTWDEQFVSAVANTGFQSEVTLDGMGRPMVVSINRDKSTLWLTFSDGTDMHEKLGPMIFADPAGSQDVMRANTIRCLSGLGGNNIAGMLPNGGFHHSKITLSP